MLKVGRYQPQKIQSSHLKIVLLFLLITFEVDESLAVILSIQMFVQEVIAFIQLLTERLLARI